MASKNDHIDPDDFFADSRMTFGEHIEDLRTHLIRAIKGFLIAFLLAFIIAKPVLHFIQAPVQRQLVAYWERYYYANKEKFLNSPEKTPVLTKLRHDKVELREEFGYDASMQARVVDLVIKHQKALRLPEDDPSIQALLQASKLKSKEGPAINLVPAFEKVLENLSLAYFVDVDKIQASSRWTKPMTVQIPDMRNFTSDIHKYLKEIQPPALTTLSVQEAFVVYIKVALLTGLVLGSPWIFYQIWSFIAAGLYPHEKKYVNYMLPFSLGLFLGGVAVCEFLVMDKAIEALLWFNEFLGMAPDLRLNEWLGFAILMPLIFGISFQTPLVMLFIQRIGIVSVDTFRSKRRIIWFLMAVFAAVITPSTDPVSMLLLWIPMTLLFELGIYLCKYLPGKPLLDFAELPESEEMVEV